jgi:hypothetical protein
MVFWRGVDFLQLVLMLLIFGLPLSVRVIIILLMVRRNGSLMVSGLIIALLLFGQADLVDLESACSLFLWLFGG